MNPAQDASAASARAGGAHAGVQWLRAGRTSDFEVGTLGASVVAGRRVCIGRLDSGFFAVDDTCPHAGGSLAGGIVQAGQLICPLHAWGFDIGTGACDDAPGCAVAVHEVRTVGDEIQVRLAPPPPGAARPDGAHAGETA